MQKITDFTPIPSVSDLEFEAYMTECLNVNGVQDIRHIAIAVSGGGDSMALTVLIDEWAKNRNIQITALTVDHQLRSDSRTEAEWVRAELKKRDINHHILTWQHDNPIEIKIQEQARISRYDLLKKYCLEHGIMFLAVAHNREDQVETFFQRLSSGSGVDGLSCMALSAEFGNKYGSGFLIRPVLTVKGKNLRATCVDRGISWVDDPSNDKDKYARIRFRRAQEFLESEGLTIQRISNVIQKFSRASDYLSEQANTIMTDIVHIYDMGYVEIDLDKFKELHIEMALRILNKCLMTVSGQKYSPKYSSLELLYKSLDAKDFSGNTLHGCVVKFINKSNLIRVYREDRSIKESLEILNTPIIWDNRFSISFSDDAITDIYISNLGVEGYASIKGEIENKANLPKQILETLPSIWQQDKVIAVPHLKYGDKNILQHCSIRFLCL